MWWREQLPRLMLAHDGVAAFVAVDERPRTETPDGDSEDAKHQVTHDAS